MRRRKFIVVGGRSLLGLMAAGPVMRIRRSSTLLGVGSQSEEEPLYNGIVPPSPFPPVLENPWSTDELPYYIIGPPPVIQIDTGRQLFVDDFLIESMAGLTRTYYQAEPYEGNPIVSPTDEDIHKRVDNDGYNVWTQLACPYSDGVWWDLQARKFRAWYQGGPNSTRLVESNDGFEWTRVGTDGIVMSIPPERDSGTVWIDYDDPDPKQRYKMAYYSYLSMANLGKNNWIFVSEDGVSWPPYDQPISRSAYYSSNPDTLIGDRSTFLYNPFRKKWIWSLRDIRDRRAYGGLQYHRMRRYWEGDDLVEAASGLAGSGYWIEADTQDLQEAGPPGRPYGTIPQVYNVDGFPYESLMVFGITINSSDAWQDRSTGDAFPKRNEIYLGFSRDGFYMTRASGSDRKPFVTIGAPNSWNEGNVQTVGSGCVIVGDPEAESLRFFFSGRNNELLEDGTLMRRGYLGFATIRRDGFASIDAAAEGTLTTRLLRFDSPNGFLFVNADVADGSLMVEALDENGTVVSGFERESCTPLQSDSTKSAIAWADGDSLAALSGVPFRLRFHLNAGRLFSFWVAPTRAGASEGYLASGGPLYESYRDESPPDTTGTDPGTQPEAFFVTVAPNPIGESATLTYDLEAAGQVRIQLFDLQGRAVRTIMDRTQSAGPQIVSFERNDLPAGVYFCNLRTATHSRAVKIVLVDR